MIYSRSAEYAIRACIDMAELKPGAFAMVKQIAARTSAPSHFLSKILQQLARETLLRSNKGPTGGFCLRMPAMSALLLMHDDYKQSRPSHNRHEGMPDC